MAKEYKIIGVSEKVKNWSSKFGDFTTYYVRLAGEGDTAIQLNKKSDSPIPKEGDELYGEIQETEFGSKFKSQKRPFGGASQSAHSKPESPETQEHIARSVALKAAVDFHGDGDDRVAVLDTANTFLGWLQSDYSKVTDDKPKTTGSQSVETTSTPLPTQEEKSQPARDPEYDDLQPPEDLNSEEDGVSRPWDSLGKNN